MKCPHCLVEVNPKFIEHCISDDKDGDWSIFWMKCPNEKRQRFIIDLAVGTQARHPSGGKLGTLGNIKNRYNVRPFNSSRPPVPSVFNV